MGSGRSSGGGGGCVEVEASLLVTDAQQHLRGQGQGQKGRRRRQKQKQQQAQGRGLRPDSMECLTRSEGAMRAAMGLLARCMSLRDLGLEGRADVVPVTMTAPT